MHIILRFLVVWFVGFVCRHRALWTWFIAIPLLSDFSLTAAVVVGSLLVVRSRSSRRFWAIVVYGRVERSTLFVQKMLNWYENCSVALVCLSRVVCSPHRHTMRCSGWCSLTPRYRTYLELALLSVDVPVVRLYGWLDNKVLTILVLIMNVINVYQIYLRGKIKLIAPVSTNTYMYTQRHRGSVNICVCVEYHCYYKKLELYLLFTEDLWISRLNDSSFYSRTNNIKIWLLSFIYAVNDSCEQ